MANKRPDIYEHNNPNYAFVDSDFVRGGTRTPVADLSELYSLSIKTDQLKERSTRVFVIDENAYYELVDIVNSDNPSGWEKELQIESEIPEDFFISTWVDGKYLTYEVDGEYYEFDLEAVTNITVNNSNEILRDGNNLFITVNFTQDASEPMYLIALYGCKIIGTELVYENINSIQLPLNSVHGTCLHREFLYLITRGTNTEVVKINSHNISDIEITELLYPGSAGDLVAYEDKLYLVIGPGIGQPMSIVEMSLDIHTHRVLIDINNETGYTTVDNLPIGIYNGEIYVPMYGTGSEFGIKVYGLDGTFKRKGIVDTEADVQLPGYAAYPHWMGFYGSKILITTILRSAIVRVDTATLSLEETLPLNNLVITDDNSIFRNGYVYLNSEISSLIPGTDATLLKVYYRDFTDASEELQGYNGNNGSFGSINSISYKNTVIASNNNTYFLHEQNSPSATWVCIHNLGKIPIVDIIDSANQTVVAEVTHNSVNQTTIAFSGALTGKAIFKT